MGTDLSRIRSNPLLDFAGVELKQGGVLLDADFNEFVALVDRRLRATASDILGRSTVSFTTPDAFKITAVAGGLSIGKGRLYVDGLLAENHGAESADPADAAKKLFDPLMAEVNFADPIAYSNQPYLPGPPALPAAGRHLVYLDVWEREVTHLERPGLVEPAVGVETSSRMQIMWQVRVLEPDAGNADCGSPDDDLAGWAALTAASTGRLTTGIFDVPPEDDPCELPPTGGYRGLENQTYRVEVHDPGQPGGKATFKWSRENASVGSRVASVISSTELELQTLGRDDVLRFNSGDWVEIIDDVRELSQRCGEMRRITVNEAARHITFTAALPAEMIPSTFPNSDFPRERNLRVRRWDQRHKVLQTGAGGTTSVFQDLDATGSAGVIKVPAAGTTLLLDNGVTVNFASTGAERAGDFWVFAARTADASVELLANEPPRGIHHHYARLGIWDVAADAVTDCRTPRPPGGAGHDCGCTECVTPQSHASGQFTIQAAVDRVRDTGGSICLGVGHYQLDKPVQLNGARAIRIRGQGAATLIVTPGTAFSIVGGIALAIEDLAILSLGRGSAISVGTVLGVTLQRLIIAVLGGNDSRGAAIALSGVVAGAAIRDNVLIAPVAIRAIDPSAARENDPRPPFLLSASLRVEDNVLWCQEQAVALAGTVLHLMATRIAGNEIVGCKLGAITVLGLCGAGASMRVCDNSIDVNGPGITAGVDGLWISANKLVTSTRRDDKTQNGAGIALRTGLDPNGANQCQIVGNQISGFLAAGILIASPTRELIVKQNIIERCGNGIVAEDEAQADSVAIENNQISDIGNTLVDLIDSVVGIGVSRSDVATVAGNTLRRIGQQAHRVSLCAGIAAFGVQRLRVSGNDISAVAPPDEYIGLGAGIMVRAPYAQVDVAFNHVDRDDAVSAQSAKATWLALLIDQPLGDRLVSRIGSYAAVRIDEARTLVFGARRPYIATAVLSSSDATHQAVARGSSVSVLGNVLGARGSAPTVDVMATGDCLFNDNRCELRGNTSEIAVRLAAAATIVNANRVQGGDAAIQLLGNPKRLAVVANITTGAIVVGPMPPGAALPAPWDALNLRG